MMVHQYMEAVFYVLKVVVASEETEHRKNMMEDNCKPEDTQV